MYLFCAGQNLVILNLGSKSFTVAHTIKKKKCWLASWLRQKEQDNEADFSHHEKVFLWDKMGAGKVILLQKDNF